MFKIVVSSDPPYSVKWHMHHNVIITELTHIIHSTALETTNNVLRWAWKEKNVSKRSVEICNETQIYSVKVLFWKWTWTSKAAEKHLWLWWDEHANFMQACTCHEKWPAGWLK